MNLKTDLVVLEVVVHISTLPLMQFSYELLNISIKHRLYLIPQLYLFEPARFHQLWCTPLMGQSLNLTLRSWLLIAHYLNTQDLTLCHLVYFFRFRHFHTCTILFRYYVVVILALGISSNSSSIGQLFKVATSTYIFLYMLTILFGLTHS